MKHSYLEVTFRKGRPMAAYYACRDVTVTGVFARIG